MYFLRDSRQFDERVYQEGSVHDTKASERPEGKLTSSIYILLTIFPQRTISFMVASRPIEP